MSKDEEPKPDESLEQDISNIHEFRRLLHSEPVKALLGSHGFNPASVDAVMGLALRGLQPVSLENLPDPPIVGFVLRTLAVLAEEDMRRIHAALVQHYGQGVLLLRLPPTMPLLSLDSEFMQEHGWIRRQDA